MVIVEYDEERRVVKGIHCEKESACYSRRAELDAPWAYPMPRHIQHYHPEPDPPKSRKEERFVLPWYSRDEDFATAGDPFSLTVDACC